MSTNYIQPGEVIDYANGSTARTAGELIDIGDRVGVALVDIAKNATGSVAVTGVFDVPATLAGDVAQGAEVKTDGAGSVDDSTPAGNVAGYAFNGAATGDTTIRIALNA